MQMVIKSRMIYQIRPISVLGKCSYLIGTRTCANSSSLTGVKWCDFYQSSDNVMKTNHYTFVSVRY